MNAPDDWLIQEKATPEGLRLRAAVLRESGQPNDSGSTARHLELAADEIEGLQLHVLGLKLLVRAKIKSATQRVSSEDAADQPILLKDAPAASTRHGE